MPFGRVYRLFDVVTCGVTRWLGRACRAAWLGVGCSGQPVGQRAHVDVACGAACLTFWHPGYHVTDIYVGGLRQVGRDAHVPCGCLDQLIFTWNGTMSRNPTSY